MGLHFQYKEFIWLLGGILLLLLLFFFFQRWKKKTMRRIGDPVLVSKLIRGYSPRLFQLKFGIAGIAFAAGVFAVMNPRKPGEDGTISRKGIDVIVALDVSKSMMATDLQPNRLERAKQFINRLIDAMPDDRIGLVLFAGRAYLQMPLTTDHSAARLFVSSASTNAVPLQGTVISEALKRSANAFNTAERRFKTVVLISDGEDHDPEAIKTANGLAAEGMMINTVGIGSAEGSYIPDSVTGQNKKDENGNDVITRLNETELKEIAAGTNGIYIHLQDSESAVSQMKQQFAGIESKAFGDVSLMNFKTYYWVFAIIMFVLLAAEYFIPEKRKVTTR